MNFKHIFHIVFFSFLLIYVGCKEEGELIFHDSFEQYEVGRAPRGPWTKTGKGTIKVDTTLSHDGKASVYFESDDGFDQRALMTLTGNPLFPFAHNRISGSFYIWLEDSPADDVQWTMIEASGPVKGRSFKSMIRYGGQYRKRLMANYDTDGVASDCYQYSNAIIPEKEWVKIAWQFDGWKGTTKFWLNDELIENLCTNGSGHTCSYDDLKSKWILPVFSNLSIGWANYQSGGGKQRIWIDEVMLYY